MITDIGRDGMLAGPDVDGSPLLRRAPTCRSSPAAASPSLDDLAALAAVPGIAGVITGKALYEGRFTVAEALAGCCG